MRHLLTALVSLLLFPLGSLAQSAPRIDAQALDGTKVHLSAATRPALLILGFSRKASDGVMAWSKALTHSSWNNHAATVYEVAFLGPVPMPLRALVVRSIRKQVPVSAQSHFLVLETDEQPWKAVAGVNADDEPYLVLLDAAGNVRWRGNGPYTEALAAKVARQVAAIDGK